MPHASMTAKCDNHNLRAKLELRRHFLRKETGPLSVCDCFSGSESIWRTLRAEFKVAEYLALDVKPKRARLKLDSLRYLQNQKWAHNVIDLDAYGSPWRHFFEVCKRGLDCVVFLTVGETVWKQQQLEALENIGINFDVPAAIKGQLGPEVLAAGLASPLEHGFTILESIEALNPGGSARYFGLKMAKSWQNVAQGQSLSPMDRKKASKQEKLA